MLTYRNSYGEPSWDGPLQRPIRKWDSVMLPVESKEDILEDVEDFLTDTERDWYAAKGEYISLRANWRPADCRYSASTWVGYLHPDTVQCSI